MWSSYLITMVFMFITAAVLAEICSALVSHPPISLSSVLTFGDSLISPSVARSISGLPKVPVPSMLDSSGSSSLGGSVPRG